MSAKKPVRQNRAKNVLTQTAAKSVRGLKLPGPEILDLIRAANLFPGDGVPDLVNLFWSPDAPASAFDKAIESLPEELRAYLLEKCRKVLKEGEEQKLIATFCYQLEWARKAHETLSRLIPKIQNEEIRYLRACPLCGMFFFAVRENQHYWPEACAKRNRDGNWRRRYQEKHGRAYKPPSREPRFVAKVRRKLEKWSGPFTSTPENKEKLADRADVTLKQCEAALDYILHTKRGPTKAARRYVK